MLSCARLILPWISLLWARCILPDLSRDSRSHRDGSPTASPCCRGCCKPPCRRRRRLCRSSYIAEGTEGYQQQPHVTLRPVVGRCSRGHGMLGQPCRRARIAVMIRNGELAPKAAPNYS
ncbi:hypothetical protein BS50DRAFT_370552 [Corynespora cassiicola Philippines]|uniref:Secreted protein n=1 Tax=Corynespora cassiicola Philippines TaxID=1448308 RepID=A0A2T2NMZ0_CORCC|nr:hypothetical protein BS50DRAFT_370552 [Corynespora cassiicola Philippines]